MRLQVPWRAEREGDVNQEYVTSPTGAWRRLGVLL